MMHCWWLWRIWWRDGWGRGALCDTGTNKRGLDLYNIHHHTCHLNTHQYHNRQHHHIQFHGFFIHDCMSTPVSTPLNPDAIKECFKASSPAVCKLVTESSASCIQMKIHNVTMVLHWKLRWQCNLCGTVEGIQKPWGECEQGEEHSLGNGHLHLSPFRVHFPWART